LEPPEVPCREVDESFDFISRKCYIGFLQWFRKEWKRKVKWAETEFAPQNMRRRVRDMQLAETAIRHFVILVRITPTTYSALRVGVPER
jgi:hypothetical protein